MTNDNIRITNAQMAEASAASIDDFFDEEGNLIPFDIEETFTQISEDVTPDAEGIVKVDVANTSH